MEPNVYIVIPHYNNWSMTHARLWELYKHCGESITEVVVVDDCSTDDATAGGLKWWEDFGTKYKFRVTSIRTPENLNFLKASNFGLQRIVNTFELSEPDIIILLSNDVEIRSNFIPQVTHLIRQPKIMVGGVMYFHDTGWNKFGDKIYSYLEGWLLALRALDWKELGYFDERFSPSDYEDVDLSTKALENGFLLTALNNPGLHHIGGQSIHYGEERLKRTNENKKKFEDKWIK